MYCVSLPNQISFFCVFLWFLCARIAKKFFYYLPLMSDTLHEAHRDLKVFHIPQVELLRAGIGDSHGINNSFTADCT